MASEIKVDTISEKTSANGVTIDGVSLKDSKIATANSVDSDAYVDGSIDTAHIDALQVTGAKLNTDVISAQTELASAPADADEFMVSDGGVLKRIDYSLIKGGTNSPSFAANLSADQSFSQGVWTKITCDTEISDTDGCYDNTTNYRFTPTTAGRYYVWSLFWQDGLNTYHYGAIRKNGSAVLTSTAIYAATLAGGQNTNGVVDMNGSSDYVEFWAVAANEESDSFTPATRWGAFRIIE